MLRGGFFLAFLISGFCALVYQVVWLRLAMAQYGVTSAMVAIVLSVFMVGLAGGSWGGGVLAGRIGRGRPDVSLRAYAVCELVIALSGASVPLALQWGRQTLLEGESWGSGAHHAIAGAWVGAVLLPFTAAMGATFPLALASLRASAATSSFGHLYTANVLGAAAGTLASALVLIEVLGFAGTLRLAAGLNAAVAAGALLLSLRVRPDSTAIEEPAARNAPVRAEGRLLLALFTTGFVTMALEVVWVRQFAPFLGNVVYAFALILATYLVATFAGSAAYRAFDAALAGRIPGAAWWIAAAAGALLPLVFTDPRVGAAMGLGGGVARAASVTQVALALGPFCAILGLLLPWLVDRWSGGDPRRAGKAYAVNTIGCIAGPLCAGFVLLPRAGEPEVTGLLAGVLLAGGLFSVTAVRKALPQFLAGAIFIAGASLSALGPHDRHPDVRIRRDGTATVVVQGRGMESSIAVNGIGMTSLTPITKMMAHLPLAWLDRTPTRGLAICFGMGTSFRSMHTWGIDTVAVELVPSVPTFFADFHADAQAILASPLAHIVIDDGRRFLERSPVIFDVVTLDPPPPVEAAGSSLLYSREFYRTVRGRLAEDGILQAWIPYGEPMVIASMVSALHAEFPHVRGFRSVEGWGLHLLASGRPLPDRTALELAARLPPAAAADLVEWGPYPTADQQFAAVLGQEQPLDREVTRRVAPLTDDRPVNEYYLLRRWLASRQAPTGAGTEGQ